MKRKFFAIMLAFVMCFAVAGLCIGCASKTNDKTAYELWLEQGHSGTMDDFYEWLGVKDGPVGEAGVGIASVALVDGKLVITYTNGSKSDPIEVPTVPGNPGEPGAAGVGVANIALEDGKLVVTYTDGSKSDPIEVPTVPGNPGADGVGIKDITISDEGILTITYTDDREPLSFNVKGEQGDAGDNGLGFDNIAVDNGDVVITIGGTVVRIPANIPNFCVEHNYDEVEFAPHTCDENNVVTNGVYMQVCSECGLSRIVREARHTFEETVHAPNCTDYGFTALTCTECGYVDGEEHDIVDALGHAWEYGYAVVEEGKTICEDGGMIVDICKTCGEVSAPRFSEAIGHNVVNKETGEASWTLIDDINVKDPADTGRLVGICTQCPEMVEVILPVLSDEHYTVEQVVIKEPCLDREVAERFTIWVDAKGEIYHKEETEEEGVFVWVDADGNRFDEVEGAQSFSFDRTTPSNKHKIKATIEEKVVEVFVDATKAVDAEWLKTMGGKEFIGEEATCTAPGRGYFKCSVCGELVYVDTTVEHDLEKVAYEGQEPTCDKPGLGREACKNCDYAKENVEIPALGEHPAESLSYEVVMKGEVAYINIKCSTCGMDKLEELEGEPVIVEATCTSEGSITYSYKAADGETYTHVEPIGKLNHKCGEVRIGATCLAELLVKNGGKEFVGEESTCVDPGRGYFTCADCGEMIYVTTLAHGKHSFDEETYKAPTCTTAGQGTCTVCGQSDESIAPALGHAYELKVEKLPTATETGLAKVVCAREENGCGHTVIHAEVVLPVLGDSVYEVEHEVLPTCSSVGNDIYTIHVLAWDFANGLAPTTVAYSFNVEVKTTGHTLNNKIMGEETEYNTPGVKEFIDDQATCMKPGRGYFTCEVCGEQAYITTTGADRHSGEILADTDSTCTERGYTTTACKLCNHEVTIYKDVLDHEYKFELITAPSAEGKGEAKVVCTREENGCGHSVINTYELPSIKDGSYELEVITAPTCSTAGLHKYTGHVLVWDFVNGLEPTTADFTFEVKVEALGHSYDDNAENKPVLYTWSAIKTEALQIIGADGKVVTNEAGLPVVKTVDVKYEYAGFICDDCGKVIVVTAVASYDDHVLSKYVLGETGALDALVIKHEVVTETTGEEGAQVTTSYDVYSIACSCEDHDAVVIEKTPIVETPEVEA